MTVDTSTSHASPAPAYSVKLPEAIFSVSRNEYPALELTVYERSPTSLSTASESPPPGDILSNDHWQSGVIPDDLWGHLFIAGAAGYSDETFQADRTPLQPIKPADGGWTALLNGEGMVHRLDFHQTPEAHQPSDSSDAQAPLCRTAPGKVWLTSALIKTPDHYADEALGRWAAEEKPSSHKTFKADPSRSEVDEKATHLDFLHYYNYSLFRLSFLLGVRNTLNTAFLPMPFPDGSQRLLATWDAGRPYEIDPVTLQLIAPVGWNWQWHGMVSVAPPSMMNPPITSSAHPQFDSTTGEMFTVNVVKSLGNFLRVSRMVLFDVQEWLTHKLKLPWLGTFVQSALNVTLLFIFRCVSAVLAFLGIGGRDAVYLNRWQGKETAVQQWQVVQEDGQPVKIRQTMHQLGLTKRYLVLADTAFKIAPEDALPSFGRKNFLVKLLRQLRSWLSYPQLPYTDLYIVARQEMQPFVNKVKAKRVRIQPETAHFLTDYDDTDDRITLHVAHSPATDPAEFVHQGDRSFYPSSDSAGTPAASPDMSADAGMFASPMDVNRLGYWVIDAKQGRVKQQVLTSEAESRDHLWWLTLYAWRDDHPGRLTNTYWSCWGCWPELLSQYIVHLYEHYEGRVVPVQELIDTIIKPGKPARLVRLAVVDPEDVTQTPTVTIADHYEFPRGFFISSPQFIPRKGSEGETAGYVVTVVLYGNTSEFWVFEAERLSQGPRFRLCHPDLDLGLTLHTTWLQQLMRAPARPDYDVRVDYGYLIQRTGSPVIAHIFEQEVYPHVESGSDRH